MRLLAALLSAALLLAGCSGGDVAAKKPSDRLPDLTLASFDGGRPLDLGALRGPAVVNLWASWCGPCRAELPYYQAFAQKYAGKVDVVGVNFQETRTSKAKELIRQTGVRYPLYADPDGRLRAIGLPKLILVDGDGKVVFEKYVEITSEAQLEKLARTELGVTS